MEEKIWKHLDVQHYDLIRIRYLSKEGKLLYKKKKTEN